ncbi:molybdate ABC transporter substrate-binding protein [Aliiroseovarius sp. Z3]|uniref:molybdate ABC transporter substrate-binding protein n=1 Tax=Aliiroseovarius sp. Z3 TaxID=2811402 RepID=UPI0023B20EE2|nr:molybdate ABC transporter substrate-binding protein [Aliiroseovarius sp. Z3]MDE9451007.1 molybdate ABC transporter substrate-binding protein [Aliiroseovarius sp. Z3]
MFVSHAFTYTRSLCRNAVALICSAVAFAACLNPEPAQADDITVFAAASLKDALDKVVLGYEAQTGHNVSLSYAGSSVLARQISLGAPADVFVSANTDWMDVLEEGGKIVPGTRIDLLSNSLVLIAPKGAKPLTSGDYADIAVFLDGRRLAMALVDAVPAGVYGKAALETLGQWDTLAPLVAQTDNVRAALALVALGRTPLGIVYGSDAKAEPRVQVEMQFPAHSHPVIRYPAAAVAGDNTETARDFLNWLQQDATMAIFADHGFTRLEGS